MARLINEKHRDVSETHKVAKRGNEWVILKNGKVKSHHDSKEKADKALAALHIHCGERLEVDLDRIADELAGEGVSDPIRLPDEIRDYLTRKPGSWEVARSAPGTLDWSFLPKLKTYKLAEISGGGPGSYAGPMDITAPEQIFIVQIPRLGRILVDTQGFDYARYIVRLPDLTTEGRRGLRGKDEKGQLSYEDFVELAKEHLGGFGFWGHSSVRSYSGMTYIKAWVDELREAGWPDLDILLYGDWSDGRRIADRIEPEMTYDQFREVISGHRDGPYSRGLDFVQAENAAEYADEIPDIMADMGGGADESNHPARNAHRGALLRRGATGRPTEGRTGGSDVDLDAIADEILAEKKKKRRPGNRPAGKALGMKVFAKE